jgi:ribonuclease G
MGKNTLVINCDIGETRVALIESGTLAELHVERKASRGIVGNIYLGKVSRVLPGMQAAFIDIGEERAAFLHVEDLIRPADFEAYLAGGKGDKSRSAGRAAAHDDDDGDDEDEDGDDGAAHEPHAHGHHEHESVGRIAVAAALEPEPGEASDEEERAAADAEDEALEVEPDAPVLRGPDAGVDEGEVVRIDAPKDSADMATRRRRRRGGRSATKRSEVEADVKAEDGAAVAEGGEAGEGEDGEDEPGEGDGASVAAAPNVEGEVAIVATIGAESEGVLVAAEPQKPRTNPPREGGGREGRREGRGRERQGREGNKGGQSGGARTESRGGRGERPERGADRSADRGADRSDRGGEREGRGARRDGSLRLQRSTPINEVVKEGQEVIVQVTKDPIGTKGARVSSHVSLPGRYVVYMPTVEHVGVSRRIGNEIERRRLREAIEAMKPPQGGLIVRTVAEGLTKKQLKADVGYLVRQWGEIMKKREGGAKDGKPVKAPSLLFQELDVVLRTARDMFTDDVEKIVVDDKEQYQRLLRFIEIFLPERAKDIELYAGDEPIFDAYGLEDEIARALSRKVPLPSGGYLIIDQAEALTAIDVNSGRFVGKGNKDPEDTILQTNLEAVAEIAYQLRFRNIGGLIVLDLIDMERHGNREKVYRALEQALLSDKAKTSINRISELGLVEMTRKRTRESLGRMLTESCFYCDGTGQLQSRTTIAYEIVRQIRRERRSLPGYKVVVNAHPSIVDLLQTEERDVVKEAERRYQRQIMLVPHREYHLEQFDLGGQ